MPIFAIYKMMFSKASQRNMFAEDGRTVLDKAQEYLEEVLQEKLPIRKTNGLYTWGGRTDCTLLLAKW